MSAKNQTLAPLEIILVDNGRSLVDRAAIPSDIRIFYLPPRCGASKARNFGAAMARGDFLAFLDDDDWWSLEYLEQQEERVKKDDLDAVYGMVEHRRGDIVIRTALLPEQPDLIKDAMLRNGGSNGSNVVIKKEVFFYLGGFRTDLWTSEDRALLTDLLLAEKRVGVSPEAVAVVRHHTGERLRLSMRARMRYFYIYRKQFGFFSSIRYFNTLAGLSFRRIRAQIYGISARLKERYKR